MPIFLFISCIIGKIFEWIMFGFLWKYIKSLIWQLVKKKNSPLPKSEVHQLIIKNDVEKLLSHP